MRSSFTASRVSVVFAFRRSTDWFNSTMSARLLSCTRSVSPGQYVSLSCAGCHCISPILCASTVPCTEAIFATHCAHVSAAEAQGCSNTVKALIPITRRKKWAQTFCIIAPSFFMPLYGSQRCMPTCQAKFLKNGGSSDTGLSPVTSKNSVGEIMAATIHSLLWQATMA